MAGKPHKPTSESRAEVRALSCFTTHDEIAKYLGITRPTLIKHYRKELDESAGKVHARVGQFLITAATGDALKLDNGATFRDCLTAAIFYGKTRMGLKETAVNEFTGKDGSPIEIKLNGKKLDTKKIGWD